MELETRFSNRKIVDVQRQDAYILHKRPVHALILRPALPDQNAHSQVEENEKL